MVEVIGNLCRLVVLVLVAAPALNYSVTAPDRLSRFLVAGVGLLATLLLTAGQDVTPASVLTGYAFAQLTFFVLFRKTLPKAGE